MSLICFAAFFSWRRRRSGGPSRQASTTRIRGPSRGPEQARPHSGDHAEGADHQQLPAAPRRPPPAAARPCAASRVLAAAGRSRRRCRRRRAGASRPARRHERADRDGRSKSPAGSNQPIAPQYGPRRTGSSSSMISIARIFGAPVIDPPGKVARSTSPAACRDAARPRPSRRGGARSAALDSQSRVTATEPYRHTRPRSLRSRSTIITFSARSFALARSSAASAASSLGVAPRGRVPLIGRVSILSSRARRNRSGDAETTSAPPSSRSAANGAGLRAQPQ